MEKEDFKVQEIGLLNVLKKQFEIKDKLIRELTEKNNQLQHKLEGKDSVIKNLQQYIGELLDQDSHEYEESQDVDFEYSDFEQEVIDKLDRLLYLLQDKSESISYTKPNSFRWVVQC